jgi:hypothetical protein
MVMGAFSFLFSLTFNYFDPPRIFLLSFPSGIIWPTYPQHPVMVIRLLHLRTFNDECYSGAPLHPHSLSQALGIGPAGQEFVRGYGRQRSTEADAKTILRSGVRHRERGR